MKTLAVNFKNDTIDIVKEENLLTIASKDSGVVHNQELWISVTKVCKNLGMTKSQTQTQKDRIKADDSFFCKEFPFSTSKGDRDALCIPLSKLNGWLFSISHNRVKEDVKKKLVEYKNECFEALNAHFMKVQNSERYMIEGKDPKHVINGYKSQIVQHNRKNELLQEMIDKLLEENSKMVLPAPAVVPAKRGGHIVMLDFLRYEERFDQAVTMVMEILNKAQGDQQIMKDRLHRVYPELKQNVEFEG